MKKDKAMLIFWIIFSIVLLSFFAILIIVGTANENDNLVVAGALGAIFFGILAIWETIECIQKVKKHTSNNIVLQEEKALLTRYHSIKDDEFNEVGFASFVNQGLKFEAKGKFGCIKDFNGKKGYHLAFSIEGAKMVYKPDDYEDVVNYEELLFLVELGYFDGVLLSKPENDNGIIVADITNLEGKTVKLKNNLGYFSYIHTAESDEMEVGEIKFVKWNESSKIIKFKLVATYGLCDIVAGTVELTEEKQ